MRKIALMDGTSMGDSLIVFKTNAPEKELKELERISCEIYKKGGASEDVPIWANELKDKGYVFDYVDEHQHITPFGKSTEWIKKIYPDITEMYVIENQPELAL